MPSKTKRVRTQTRRSRLLKLKPDDEIVWEDVCNELKDHFRSEKPNAKSALEALVQAGCKEKLILRGLYLFCGGDPQQMRLLRESYDLKSGKRRIAKAAESVRQLIPMIESTDKLLKDLGVVVYFTPDIAVLEKYAHFLCWFSKHGIATSRRVSGRDHHLVYLSRMVKLFTGKPHYKETAELVNATREHYGPLQDKVETFESIRQQLKRNQLMYELDYEVILSELRQAMPLNTRKLP